MITKEHTNFESTTFLPDPTSKKLKSSQSRNSVSRGNVYAQSVVVPIRPDCAKNIASSLLYIGEDDRRAAPYASSKNLSEDKSSILADTDMASLSDIELPAYADRFKRVFDICAASLLLLLLLVPMAMIAIVIKLDSRGPVLFRQMRNGVDGEEFEVYKFRSMKLHSDDQVLQATRNDTRVTAVGSFLRRSSLDELPQLINVIQGTMSLVGPRPHAVVHNEMWSTQITGYMLRHRVRPGITGLAQVNGWRGETETEYKMRQRVKHDLKYIKEWTPWLDIQILFLTVFKGFSSKNAY